MLRVCKVATLVLVLFNFYISAFAQEEVEGTAVKKLTNSKDIRDPLNEDAMYELMQKAVLDAIERGSQKIIQVNTYNKMEESSSQGYHFDNFMSTSVQKYGVTWRRTSEPKFLFLGKKLWQCSLKGIVGAAATNQDNSTPLNLDTKRTLKVRGRVSPLMIHINTGDQVSVGELVAVTKTVGAQVLNGYDRYKKVKAIAYVTRVENNFSIARIVKGFWHVREGDEIKSGRFSSHRTGFKLEYTPTGIQSFNSNLEIFSASFYTQSYISRWGFAIGLDLININNLESLLGYTNPPNNPVLMPNMGVNYHIGLIPDLLYIIPEFNVGYLIDTPLPNFSQIPVGSPKIQVALRIGAIEFCAGITYRYFYNDPYGFSGLFPNGGLKFNLNGLEKR